MCSVHRQGSAQATKDIISEPLRLPKVKYAVCTCPNINSSFLCYPLPYPTIDLDSHVSGSLPLLLLQMKYMCLLAAIERGGVGAKYQKRVGT